MEALGLLTRDLAEALQAGSPFPPDVDAVAAWLIAAGLLAALLAALLLRRGAELRAARAEARDAGALREEAIALRLTAGRLPDLEAQAAELREDRDRLQNALTAAEARAETERAAHAARMEELRGLHDALQTKFRGLATEVLEGNSKAFLDRVTERFRTHAETAEAQLTARQKAIETLVAPLSERLTAFDGALKEVERARADAYGAIRTQVQQLQSGQAQLTGETRKLVQALRAPKTRGRWGEMQLRQVFELSGMSEHVDFDTEVTTRGDAGARRPDAVVRMPGGRTLVVGAKTPLDAYLDALEAETPEAREAAIARHAGQVRQRVKELSAKAYQDLLQGTPDFVVMFIPGETFLAAAAEADPGLIERGIEARVLIATPTTLIALLRAVAFGWQQEALAENAVKIQAEAKELYGRLATFAGHLGKVGSALGRSVESYNAAMGSLEARILPTARKFEAMQVTQAPAEALGEARRIETTPRPATAEELVGGD